MPVLIDGNNLLHAALDAEPERPPGRTQLCTFLEEWVRRTGDPVHVVFDGPAPARMRAEQISGSEIPVTYSGPVSADEVIFAEIRACSAPRRLRVVSSDREIIAAARRRQAKPVRSADFWSELHRTLARTEPVDPEPPEKRTGLATDQTDAWAAEFGLDADPEPDEPR